MNKKLLSLYGLKWNPFSPEVPAEALCPLPRLENFFWRVEHGLAREGGFALISGEPGYGKSVALRLLSERLSLLGEVRVGVLEHPQCNLADFYREMGDIFSVELKPHNRWGGFKVLRERWQAHIESTLVRPVLLIDEVQEMKAPVLSELRLLTSAHFDSRSLLSVVLAGDGRLLSRLRTDELLPLGSRIRSRLSLEAATREELLTCLKHLTKSAGNARLMTAELMATLCEHALGNYRVLVTMANELLAAAARQERTELDEKLYLEVFAAPSGPRTEGKAKRPTRTRR